MGNSYGISANDEFNEIVERRSPFAKSEFVFGVTTGDSFEVPYTNLNPDSSDVIYALVINAEAELHIWRDPEVTQIPGILRLKGSATTLADFLLFIPRP